MLTNWAGDYGVLEEFYCEVRRFNLIGDLTTCEGQVTEKEAIDDGAGHVRLDIAARDQRGHVTAKGWATVRLPRRG